MSKIAIGIVALTALATVVSLDPASAKDKTPASKGELSASGTVTLLMEGLAVESVSEHVLSLRWDTGANGIAWRFTSEPRTAGTTTGMFRVICSAQPGEPGHGWSDGARVAGIPDPTILFLLDSCEVSSLTPPSADEDGKVSFQAEGSRICVPLCVNQEFQLLGHYTIDSLVMQGDNPWPASGA